MMSANADRDPVSQRQRTRIGGPSLIAALFIIAIASIAHGDGGSAAERAAAKTSQEAAITLAGRWQGPRYVQGARSADDADCAGTACQLTYDIVACPEGWCGIVVTNATSCGGIALRLKGEAAPNHRNAFTGRLELAKGSEPYTVEAWYAPPGETAGEGSDIAHLNFVGDTGGGGMLMMRRSFPFQAELARIGDAACTLDKATS